VKEISEGGKRMVEYLLHRAQSRELSEKANTEPYTLRTEHLINLTFNNP